jgi:hypothetical protein
MTEREAHAAYVDACMRDIERLRTELALLEDGQTGTCGPHTDYQWVDTTERHKSRLRTAIAEQAAAIMDFRRRTGFAGAPTARLHVITE